MITKPSYGEMLEAVRIELQNSVKPAVSDQKVIGLLDMIDSILGGLVRRSDHEAAWMHEEISSIEALAQRLLTSGADSDGQVAEKLAALQIENSGELDISSVQKAYDLAGKLLSQCIDVAFIVGGELRQDVERILQARVSREVLIRGDFSLAGRD